MESEQKPSTVEEYLDRLNPKDRGALSKIRQAARKAIPESEEGISYGMPVIRFHGMVLYYASFKEHYSLFVSPGFKTAFAEELKSFSQTKSAIHFPKGSTIPVSLIARMARHIAQHNLQKFELKSRKGALSKKPVVKK